MSDSAPIVEFIFVAMERPIPRGLGRHRFRSAPQIGHHIMILENNAEQAYEVVAVLHPNDLACTAGDLMVRHVGTALDFRTSNQEWR
jgi:hypothetical protein